MITVLEVIFLHLILYQKGSCAYLAEKNSGPGAEATTIS